MAYSVSRALKLLLRESNALDGYGVNEGMNWLSEILKRKKK